MKPFNEFIKESLKFNNNPTPRRIKGKISKIEKELEDLSKEYNARIEVNTFLDGGGTAILWYFKSKPSDSVVGKLTDELTDLLKGVNIILNNFTKDWEDSNINQSASDIPRMVARIK